MEGQIRQWMTTHRRTWYASGYVILGPPGIGKTTFVKQHSQLGYVDADDILGDLGVHKQSWNNTRHSKREEKQHYMLCDQYLATMKQLGVRVIGSLFWEYIPDAIVLIPKNTHYIYVQKRADLDWDIVMEIRTFLAQHAQKNNVKLFDSILKAAMDDDNTGTWLY
tara:strand:- start:88 stop:582 length:495 start_codon:yes stop_codon:yes gene_type:complete